MVFPAKEGVNMFGSLDNFSDIPFGLAVFCLLIISLLMMRICIFARKFPSQVNQPADMVVAKVRKS
ncbi:MAG: hypothetical protein Q8M27_08775 [Methylotenera sp.]|nr:hypothetical protein [Methylotenera sp.]